MKNDKQSQNELVCLSLDTTGEAPDTIQLFAYGRTNYTNNQNQPDYYEFLEADADKLIAEFDRRGIDGMIDYNHQQLRAKANGQPAPAAGWFTALEKSPQGLNIKTSWTDRAKDFILNKEYRYTSPLFRKDRLTKRITGLVNLALTNIPGTDRQQALIALELDLTTPELNPRAVAPTKGNNTMNKKLFELVGLEMPVAEEQQLVALEGAINNLIAGNATLKNENATLSTANATLQADLDAIKNEADTVALEAAIAEGIAKGKLSNASANTLRTKPLDQVLTALELIPENSVVPLERAPEGAGIDNLGKSTDDAGKVVALSDDDIAYCTAHGYDQAEFAKSLKK